MCWQVDEKVIQFNLIYLKVGWISMSGLCKVNVFNTKCKRLNGFICSCSYLSFKLNSFFGEDSNKMWFMFYCCFLVGGIIYE